MASQYSPLVHFALKGLANCWQEDLGWFSHAYRMEPEPHNVSLPQSDLYYTLNVLLGFAALPDKGESLPYDIPEIFSRCCRQMISLPVPLYAYGMAMWTAAELQLDLPGETRDKIGALLRDESAWSQFTAQDIGLLVSGTSKLHAMEDRVFSARGLTLFNFLCEQLGNTRSGLFFNSSTGFRRRFATYATGVYSTLACFHFAQAYSDEKSVSRGLQCVEALARKQGPMGEWPWFYEAYSGRVVDCYQVYSVHQNGMAPAYLHLANEFGYSDARRQIEHGFEWIFGQNEMGCSMLVPEKGVILRAQKRAQPKERHQRAVRGIINWLAHRESKYVGSKQLCLNNECRSYHLGWVLHSFGGRDDYPSITHHRAFNCIPRSHNE